MTSRLWRYVSKIISKAVFVLSWLKLEGERGRWEWYYLFMCVTTIVYYNSFSKTKNTWNRKNKYDRKCTSLPYSLSLVPFLHHPWKRTDNQRFSAEINHNCYILINYRIIGQQILRSSETFVRSLSFAPLTAYQHRNPKRTIQISSYCDISNSHKH